MRYIARARKQHNTVKTRVKPRVDEICSREHEAFLNITAFLLEILPREYKLDEHVTSTTFERVLWEFKIK